MVECSIHGSDHEPWQCKGDEDPSDRLVRYEEELELIAYHPFSYRGDTRDSQWEADSMRAIAIRALGRK